MPLDVDRGDCHNQRMTGSLICSRSDRLGDLVLTLPALGLLKKARPEVKIGLHVSEYAADLARLALHNKICDFILFETASREWIEEGAGTLSSDTADLVAFFHGPAVKDLRRHKKFRFSLAPRTKLATLWSYSSTLSQKRSRVEKSEMEYNVDLARAYLRAVGHAGSEFMGLPKLEIPPAWKTPSSGGQKIAAIFVNNGASARNWPLEKYFEIGTDLKSRGFEVHYHYAGVNSPDLKRRLEVESTLKVIAPFAQLKELLTYISGVSYLVASSTGPLHLGHALGVPVLGIYPREPRVQSFKRWRPHGYWHNQGVELIEF